MPEWRPEELTLGSALGSQMERDGTLFKTRTLARVRPPLQTGAQSGSITCPLRMRPIE